LGDGDGGVPRFGAARVVEQDGPNDFSADRSAGSKIVDCVADDSELKELQKRKRPRLVRRECVAPCDRVENMRDNLLTENQENAPVDQRNLMEDCGGIHLPQQDDESGCSHDMNDFLKGFHAAARLELMIQKL